MIKSFSCADTAALFQGQIVPRFANIRAAAERKLQMLDKAACLDDLRNPPGNRLEALKGDRQNQYSIRINSQWRLCFSFKHGEARNAHIVDYH
ncbi:MAG: type II toxin-antitoxin system RelE/ParE family toxin [Oxalobacter formigenes]|nr:type II toxin-antitoxin system RelE/ParE family toxin [Oxalobacter formigenes]